MRSDEAEAAVGTTRKARAPITRACVGQEAESRRRGVGAAGRPPDRSGRVRARSPGTYSRPEKRVRTQEGASACRATCRFEPAKPAETGWNGREGQPLSPAVAGVTFKPWQVRASGADCPGGLPYVPAFFQGDARRWRASSTFDTTAATDGFQGDARGWRASSTSRRSVAGRTRATPRAPRICLRRRTVRNAPYGPRTRSTCPGGLLYVPAFFQGDARGWRASSTSRRSVAR